MLTTFDYLPEKQVSELVQLVQKIVQAVSPEKVICFGHRCTVYQDWSSFFNKNGYVESINPTYYFLIITAETEKHADHEVIQMIEQQAEQLDCNVTCVIHKLGSVNESLAKGSRFFSTLYHRGILVYNGSGLPLTVPPEMPAVTVLKSKIQENWVIHLLLLNAFFQSATHCL
jgi:hypothetical protein